MTSLGKKEVQKFVTTVYYRGGPTFLIAGQIYKKNSTKAYIRAAKNLRNHAQNRRVLKVIYRVRSLAMSGIKYGFCMNDSIVIKTEHG
jgi:hypothetical protein